MADTNDQNALTAEESALLTDMQNDTDTGTEAGPTGGDAGTPAKPAADAPAGSDAEGEKKGGMVPHGAFHEEREKRKKLEAAFQTEREERLKLEARTNLILERLTPKAPAPEEEKIPDINEDPAGFLAAHLKKTGKTVEQLQAESDQRKTADDNQKAVGAIISRAAASEREFIATTPDYDDAGAHLQASRNAELEAMGYTDPNIRNQIIQNEKLAIADQAFKQGKNPAEIVYAMAKLRGYTKKAPAAEVPDAKARVENIDKGQKTSESLTNARGQGPTPLTATRLLEMSEAEFAKYVDTPEGRAVMGG